MRSCRPVLGISIVGQIREGASIRTQNWARECVENNDKVIEWLSSEDSIEYVALASPFNFTNEIVYEGEIRNYSDVLVIESFTKTINKLRGMGKKPVVVSPIPNDGSDIGRCAVRALMLGYSDSLCDFNSANYSVYTKKSFHTIDLIKDIVPLLYLEKFICKNDFCDVVVNNIVLYRDDGHLSNAGSEYLGLKYDLAKHVIELADRYWE